MRDLKEDSAGNLLQVFLKVIHQKSINLPRKSNQWLKKPPKQYLVINLMLLLFFRWPF